MMSRRQLPGPGKIEGRARERGGWASGRVGEGGGQKRRGGLFPPPLPPQGIGGGPCHPVAQFGEGKTRQPTVEHTAGIVDLAVTDEVDEVGGHAFQARERGYGAMSEGRHVARQSTTKNSDEISGHRIGSGFGRGAVSRAESGAWHPG